MPSRQGLTSNYFSDIGQVETLRASSSKAAFLLIYKPQKCQRDKTPILIDLAIFAHGP